MTLRLALLALPLAACWMAGCDSNSNDYGTASPTPTASPSPSPSPTQAADRWLSRIAAGSGFDHAAGFAPAPGGDFLMAGTITGEAGEVVHLGGDDDPGRIALTSPGTGAAFVSRHAADGTLLWAAVATSDIVADARAITDIENGAVVAGNYQGSMSFGAGGAPQLSSAGMQDVFLARYGFDGVPVWAARIGGPANELVESVVTLLDGSIAVTGRYEDGARFGEGADTVTLASQQYDDAFVARFSAGGQLLWVRDAGGQGNADALASAPTADGGLVVTGEFQNDLVFGRGTPQELTLLSAGENDFFLVKFDAAGAHEWAKRAGGADLFPGFGERGNDLAVLEDGAILVTGEFEGPSTFGFGEPNETTIGAADDWPNRKMFIARFTGDGALDWVRASAGTSNHSGWTIGEKILPRADGSFLVFGQFYDDAIFGPGEATETTVTSQGGFDLALASYESDGGLQWVRTAGGSEDQFASDLAWLGDGLLIAGEVRGATQFDLRSDWHPTLASIGLSDAFAAKFVP